MYGQAYDNICKCGEYLMKFLKSGIGIVIIAN